MNQMNALKQKQLEKFALKMHNAMMTKVGRWRWLCDLNPRGLTALAVLKALGFIS